MRKSLWVIDVDNFAPNSQLALNHCYSLISCLYVRLNVLVVLWNGSTDEFFQHCNLILAYMLIVGQQFEHVAGCAVAFHALLEIMIQPR